MGAIRARVILAAAIALAAATWWQPAAAAPLPQSSPCATAVATAIAQRGKQYIWGAKGPNAFDCSGLTQYAWASAGYNIGTSTYDQATAGVAIPCTLNNLIGEDTCWEPGDLIFLRYTGGQHVAMYIGDNLFADAYNQDNGVIIHDVVGDQFYWNHFWQARRIVDCGDITITPPDPDSPSRVLPPSLEQIPDILAPVSFTVPQCGDCNPDGTILLPPTQWSGSWPVGFEALNLPLVFQTVISWLAWQVGELFRILICWLLSMLARLAFILQTGINAGIYGVNSLFKLLVLIWLSLKSYFLAFWEMLESIRLLLFNLASGLAGLVDFGLIFLQLLLFFGTIIGQLLALFGQLGLVLLGMIGWIGGLALGFFTELQLALTGTTIPTQLDSTHVIYRATRGLLEGVRDSAIGWAFVVIWALAYVTFFTWLARFLSASKAGTE